MSIKELLFSLKYKREGDAYFYWKLGAMIRASFHAKNYPNDAKTASPELYEKKKSVKMPDWLKEDYGKRINKMYGRR